MPKTKKEHAQMNELKHALCATYCDETYYIKSRCKRKECPLHSKNFEHMTFNELLEVTKDWEKRKEIRERLPKGKSRSCSSGKVFKPEGGMSSTKSRM